MNKNALPIYIDCKNILTLFHFQIHFNFHQVLKNFIFVETSYTKKKKAIIIKKTFLISLILAIFNFFSYQFNFEMSKILILIRRIKNFHFVYKPQFHCY